MSLVGEASAEGWRYAIADAHGRFRFDLTPDGRRRILFVHCAKEGYADTPPRHYFGPERVGGQELAAHPYRFADRSAMARALGEFVVSPGEVVRVAVALVRGGRISGRVSVQTPGGIMPVTQELFLKKKRGEDEPFLAPEWLDVALVVPNDAGEFEVSDLAPGDGYAIEAEADGYAADEKVFFDVRARETTRVDHVLQLAGSASVTGALLLSGQQATQVKGVVVVSSRIDPTRPGCLSNVKAGRFRCVGLPAGPYSVTARVDSPELELELEGSADVSLHVGEVAERAILLSVVPTEG